MKKRRIIFEILTIIFVNFLYAAGVVFFILPSGLITGGTTGIALFINRYTGMPLSYFVFGFNVVMFILGLLFLGRKFAFTTLISTFCFPIALELLHKISGDFVVTNDIFLCTLFGGICIGASIAIVIRVGASTGGLDIPPMILYKYFRLPISASLYVADCVILALQVGFNNREKVLYGIVLVLIYSVILDKLLMLGTNKMQIKVISNRSKDIKDAIISEIDRGVTLLHGSSGYLGNELEIILSVVSNRELSKVEKLVHNIDEDAFVMISRVTEVRGRGFSAKKKYL